MKQKRPRIPIVTKLDKTYIKLINPALSVLDRNMQESIFTILSLNEFRNDRVEKGLFR